MDEINKNIDTHKKAIKSAKKLIKSDINYHIEQINKLKNERRNMCLHMKKIAKLDDRGEYTLYCPQCNTYLYY